MALADPQSVTFNSIASSLPLMTRDKTGTTYRSSDGKIGLNVQNSSAGKRVRTLIQFNETETVVDSITGLSVLDTITVNVTINKSNLASVARVVNALTMAADYIKAGSGANATKIAGGES